MKKYFIYIVFLISSQSFAQSYIPFPDSGAWWTADVYINITIPYSPMMQYYIDGDTLINNYQYHKVFSFDTVSNYPSYTTAFRQDIPGKKIYMVDWFSSTEYLAYDFALAVGDTFSLDSLRLFQVTTVDSILVQGQYRKRIRLHSLSNWCLCTCDPDWVEGIGSMYGFIPVQCFELGYAALRCFGINNQTVYPDTGSCYRYFPTGMDNDNILISEFRVYPNPTPDKITVDFNEKEFSATKIELYSLTGLKVFIKNITNASAQVSIDLKDLNRGIYFVHLYRSGKTYITKIVLQ